MGAKRPESVVIIITNWSIIFWRHQIQHYTNQLAKDTSKQLKDLNEFPTDTAIDPRLDT